MWLLRHLDSSCSLSFLYISSCPTEPWAHPRRVIAVCHRAGLPPVLQQFPLWILLGRKLYLSLCKNMEQVTLKLNFNFLLFSNACSTTNHPGCIKKQDYTARELEVSKIYIFSLPFTPKQTLIKTKLIRQHRINSCGKVLVTRMSAGIM